MDLVDELIEVQEAAARDPASAMTWAPWARRFLASTHLRRFVRKANQIGGTTVITADCVHEIRGTNPYRPRRFVGPIDVFWFGVSIEQMAMPGGVLSKLWSMIPPGEVHPKIRFVPGKGIVGTKYPHFPFINGPGKGSNLIFRTYHQDPQTYAGVTAHGGWCDEPLPEGTYAEVSPRLWKNDAPLTVGFTPTPDMPDMRFLRKLVEASIFEEHHVPMTEAACWPEGYRRPFYLQADIDTWRKETPEAQQPMRFEAAWEPYVSDRYLTAFGDHCVRAFGLDDIPADNVLAIGIDYGLKPGKHASVMSAVVGRLGDRPKVYVIDEFQPDEAVRVEQVAEGIVAMLSRHTGRNRPNGLEYGDVDIWVGDQDARNGRMIRHMGSAQLRRELGRVARVAETKWIDRPDKVRGSVVDGLENINAMAARVDPESGVPDLVIHPRCKKLVESCRQFRGDPTDPHKDVLDAFRYGISHAIGYRNLSGLRLVSAYGRR